MGKVNYSQPSFYKFNQDSINLVSFAFDYFQNKPISNVLDLACGTGVIGIEYYLKLIKKKEIHFLEMQKEFISHLTENIQNFGVVESKIFNLDMFNFEARKKYDLILCNPPYFISENSRIGPNENKNICRIISKKDLEGFFELLKRLISKDGYICLCFPLNSNEWQSEVDESSFLCVEETLIDKIKILILQNI